MTHEQIRARCKEFLSVNMDKVTGRIVLHQEFHQRLEFFYHEALAKGLEMAADEASVRQERVHNDHHIEFKSGHGNACYDLAQWCREHADKLKETPCDTSSS